MGLVHVEVVLHILVKIKLPTRSRPVVYYILVVSICLFPHSRLFLDLVYEEPHPHRQPRSVVHF